MTEILNCVVGKGKLINLNQKLRLQNTDEIKEYKYANFVLEYNSITIASTKYHKSSSLIS